MNHFRLQGAQSADTPALLFHVRIDIRDIRSGCSGSEEGYFKAQWHPERPIPEEDLTWTPDMVARISKDKLERIDAPTQLLIPRTVDDLMQRFLQRYYTLRIWHHNELNIFSEPGELLEDFIQRCRDLLQPERNAKMRKVSEVMHHRFFQLYQNARGAAQGDDVSDQLALKMKSDLDAVFTEGKGDLSRLFLRNDQSPYQDLGRDWRVEFLPQIQERLDDFRLRLLTRYNDVVSEFEERACRVDAVQLRVSRQAIDILSRNVIWE